MFAALRFFLTRQPVMFGACVVAVAVAVFFGVQVLVGVLHFQDPAHRDQALEGWMRPRYVAMSYRLPPNVLGQALMIGPPPKGRVREKLTMEDIAAQQGIDLDTLTERVRAAAADFREVSK